MRLPSGMYFLVITMSLSLPLAGSVTCSGFFGSRLAVFAVLPAAAAWAPVLAPLAALAFAFTDLVVPGFSSTSLLLARFDLASFSFLCLALACFALAAFALTGADTADLVSGSAIS